MFNTDKKDNIVLPRPPNDELKYCYIDRKRWLINTGMFVAIVGMLGGMVLFVNGSVELYFLYAFIAFCTFSLMGKIIVDTVAPGFDLVEHKSILDNVKNDPEKVWAVPVDIFLPICGEEIKILKNTWEYIKKLKYPGSIRVYVQNDGEEEYADENGEMTSIQNLATSFGFTYVSRPNKGVFKKSGNMRYCFQKHARGDLFVIFDADFCPRDDFLLETIPRFTDNPKLGILQTPQFFEMRPEQTWVERAAAVRQEVFYRVIMTSRDTVSKNIFKKYEPAGTAICVGSNAVYRRETFMPNGGTSEIETSEDVRSGYYAITHGWDLRYIPVNLATGVCPDTIKAYFSQQYRWGSGSVQFAWSKDFWKGKCGFVKKINYLFGFTGYPADICLALISLLLDPTVVWLSDPDHIKYYNLIWVAPSIFLGYMVRPIWSAQKYPWSASFLSAAQSWAYIQAVLDRVLMSAGEWIPTGSVKKNNKFTIARVLCALANICSLGALVSGSVFRLLDDVLWYNVLPLWLMSSFRIACALPFIFNMF